MKCLGIDHVFQDISCKLKYLFMLRKLLFIFVTLLVGIYCSSQNRGNKSSIWKTISKDETVTISYNLNIVHSKNGSHFVWVKAVYHTPEWQSYFANTIGSRTPVVTTHTRAEYDGIYSLVGVRQVICFSKTGKKLYDSGDSRAAGWGYVNASDPVGIVGEYLEKQK